MPASSNPSASSTLLARSMYLLASIALCLLQSLAWAENGVPPPHVLYLNSYHPGYTWSDAIEKGIREGLADDTRQVELSVEYLDARRFPDPARMDLLADAMAIKYRGYRHDLLIVSDNDAFDFAIRYRERLFPNLPIVFCGFNHFRPEALKGISNITGVNEEIDIGATVELALKVHPATRQLVFILSTGDPSSARSASEAESSILPRYKAHFQVSVLKDASMQTIRERLQSLPSDALVFLAGQTSDHGEGRALTPEENGRLVAAASPVPVYTFWDFHLGTGVLGGHVLNGLDQGREAARLARQVLNGRKASDIPVTMSSPARDVFDYPTLQRFDIPTSALPEGAEIIDAPTSLWALHRGQIVAAIVVVVLQALLIVALVRVASQRRQALAELAEERSLLEARVRERTAELADANAQLTGEVAERRRAENGLREAITVTDTVLQVSPVPIGVYRDTGPCVMANESYARLIGTSREQLLAQSFHSIHAWHASGIHDDCLRALQTDTRQQRQIHIMTSFGREIWADCLILPVRLNNERHLLIQFVDQTERVQMLSELELHRQHLEAQVSLRTTELQGAKDLAESANRAKSTFLANLSHEIHTPLNAILGFTRILRDKNDDATQRDRLERVLKAAGGLHQILDDLLDLAALDAERMQIDEKPFATDDIARRVADATGADLRARGLNYTADLTGLPAQLKGDPQRISQMLINYVSNAAKFTEQGFVAMRGRVLREDARGLLLRFEVQDSGIGVKPEDQQRIFLSFEQADGSFTRRHGGTGLGLAINRKLARLMDGETGVSSTLGEGSTFWFTVRLKRP
ncbi:MAG: PAS domain-containing protein [Proteobacteria bacterium]|nr:PAS domain-containing protein [Pseudomonadota bacterium]